MKNWAIGITAVVLLVGGFLGIRFFSEENQNKFQRAMMASYGFKDGRVDILAGQTKPVMSWFGVEKLTTATATNSDQSRGYRYGFGYYDLNHDRKLDLKEKQLGKKYFEIGPYTMYIYRDASN